MTFPPKNLGREYRDRGYNQSIKTYYFSRIEGNMEVLYPCEYKCEYKYEYKCEYKCLVVFLISEKKSKAVTLQKQMV